jgi:hypothetical protein
MYAVPLQGRGVNLLPPVWLKVSSEVIIKYIFTYLLPVGSAAIAVFSVIPCG